MTELPHTIQLRLSNLERAALQSEGAQFALRDIVARLLLTLPGLEVRALIEELVVASQSQAKEIGAHRLAGYRDELEALREEVEHCRREGEPLPA